MRTYFENHKNQLNKVIQSVREERAYSQESLNFFQKDIALFDQIEASVCVHRLRYYQMEAIYILDYLLSLADSNKAKKNLLEKVKPEAKHKIPFLSFEMATGSGKTMLMGAKCYYLFKKYGINNFLIITPSSLDIYQKTIRNFTRNTFDSIWSETTDFEFNLITGDNYKTPSMFFDPSKDVNIFIFNIDKFGANATNSKKRWESSIWKDENGNTISIQDYLENKKLAIITDEAHHHQSRKSKQIIGGFKPEIVLEYTATAVEKLTKRKAQQSVVYKYDIRRFLEDGHGKLVRAVALDNQEKKSNKKDFSDSEKLKLITLLLIHLVKKRAVLLDQSSKGLKPVAFIKVKNDTKFTQKVYSYIKNDLWEDVENFSIILEKVKNQDLEITNLISKVIDEQYDHDEEKLREDIKKICQNTLFYHGKSTQMEKKAFDNIRSNSIELVVYMQKLDEGIDLPNIYSMAVINDTDTEFKTSVKQIIGRGVRLNKNRREYDKSENLLLTQAEKLHIVSDRGKNFEEVILSIQKEFGLTDKYLSSEQPKKQVWNTAKSDLLEGKYLPKIKADFKAKEGVKLFDLIGNIERVVQDYLDYNTFLDPENKKRNFIKYLPSAFFVEVDVFSDQETFHKEISKAGGTPTELILNKKHFNDIYSKVQKTLLCLPDTKKTREIFNGYMDRFSEKRLWYYKNDEADTKLVVNKFKDTFSYYYRNYVEKNYYDLKFNEIYAEESWPLKECFKDHHIIIPEDQIQRNKLTSISSKEEAIELIKQNYSFKGYENSIFEYVKFDSFTEKAIADFIDEVTSEVPRGLIPFWVRNERNVYFEYGSHKYFPDFLMLYKDKIYVIEAKGEVFSHTMKNTLLKKLESTPGDEIIKEYEGVLVFDSLVEELTESKSWQHFVELTQLHNERMIQAQDLNKNVEEKEKFKNYLPVYSPKNAKRKFSNNINRVKIAGWIKVEEFNYPDTVFAIQVKDSGLTPKYKFNDWVILDSKFDLNNIEGKLALYYDKSIRSKFQDGFIIRKLVIEEEDSEDLFKKLTISLKPLNHAYPEINLKGISTAEQIEVVGVEYEANYE